MLDYRAINLKAIGFAITMIMGMTFFDLLAGLANKEFSHMSTMAMIAGNKGVQGFNAVNKAKLGEKI